MGGKKQNGRLAGLLVKREGKWKWKAMYEAGWGDYMAPAVGDSDASGTQEEPKK